MNHHIFQDLIDFHYCQGIFILQTDLHQFSSCSIVYYKSSTFLRAFVASYQDCWKLVRDKDNSCVQSIKHREHLVSLSSHVPNLYTNQFHWSKWALKWTIILTKYPFEIDKYMMNLSSSVSWQYDHPVTIEYHPQLIKRRYQFHGRRWSRI